MILNLRSWQAKFGRQLAAHQGENFLLVACPAAGKTIAAGAAVAGVMRARDCNQLVVACPTVVVRDQWLHELGRMGYRMRSDFDDGWPEWVHGVCATYAQIAMRADRYAEQVRQRRTVVIFDEIHHVGSMKAWGDGILTAFDGAQLRLALSGTPFRSDADLIPFISYDENGDCKPDFAYDYSRAVRDGVCSPVHFRAHDGVITWDEDGEHRTATFSERVDAAARARRLRAALDPSQPYLAALLADAHEDLLELRERIPDAAGLVVCDSQAHAWEVDRLLEEITGEAPQLAMSDLPRSHQAIREFAEQDGAWLVSVRMVSEGVDIPRLGVIAWATAARTELLVRQVAGRALRGRAGDPVRSAIVHVPADPGLIRYAGRLHILHGVSRVRERDRYTNTPGKAAERDALKAWAGKGFINAAPFLEWIDRRIASVGLAAAVERCGWTYDTGARKLNRWRHGERARTWEMIDACHMAGLDFEEMFGEQIGEWDPRADAYAPANLRAVEAQPTESPALDITPPVPAGEQLHGAPEEADIEPPEIAPDPKDLAREAQERDERRGNLWKLLGTYAQLHQSIDPAYQLGRAQVELSAAVGAVNANSDDEQIAVALDWVRQQTALLAVNHPEHVKQLVRARRRMAIAS